MELKVKTVEFKDLATADLDNWLTLVHANEHLSSPCFHPLFAECRARAGRKVHVSLIESAQGPALLPFELIGHGQAGPLGGVMSDFHGVVAAQNHRLELAQVIRQSKLRRFAFDHLVSNDEAPAGSVSAISPVIDLGDGYEAYRQQKIAEKSKLFKKIDKYKRDLEKHLGPLRFEHHCEDSELLDTLVGLKSEQYLRSGLLDLFSFGWPLELLREITKMSRDDFRGSLLLYAGEQPVFLHFGMQTERRFHYWFPAYPVEHSRLSPGIVGLDYLLRAIDEDKPCAVDLGKGDNLYKSRFANDEITIYEGEILPLATDRFKRDMLDKLQSTVKQSPVLYGALFPLRWLTRRYRYGKRYR